MAQNVGTLISAAIRPNDSLDLIASAYASEIKGGLHTVTDSTTRDSIIFERREWGMMCYVTNEDKTYQLTYNYIDTNIMNNSNWKEFSGSGNGSGGGSNEWIDSVFSFENNQPLSPIDGDRYIIGTTPTGASWSSFQSGLVVQWNSSISQWQITTPKEGTSVRVDSEENSIYKYEGTFPSGNWVRDRMSQVRDLSASTIDGKVFTVTSNPPFEDYYQDMLFLTKFSSTNVGTTASLNINGLGEVMVKKTTKNGLKSFSPYELKTDVVYSLIYDGTYFQLYIPSNDEVFNVKHYIEPNDYIVIPQYYQYWVYSDLLIDGYLINYGHIVVCNGNLSLGSGTISNFGNLALVNFNGGLTPSFNNTDSIQFTQSNTIYGLSVSAVLTDTGATAGSYGNSFSYPILTIDSKGRVTDISTQSIDLSSGVLIGPAEDNDYTDGIFTDFTPLTPIGTAVDRFNEMLLLLAPTPPSNWNNAISGISFTSPSWTARHLSSLSTVTIYTDTTPDLTSSNSVGNQASARVDTNGLTFSLFDNGLLVGTAALSGTYTVAKTSGRIRHGASVDPYTLPTPQAGKVGFWTGITSFALAESLPSITPSSSQRTLQLFHPGTDSPETFNYYIDNPQNVTVGTITATVPTMTGTISGVPTLTTAQSVTNISFTINNVASYFWANTYVWEINSGLIAGSNGDPDVIPSFFGETGNVTGKSGQVQSGQFSNLSFSFTTKARNSIGFFSSNTTYTSNVHRVDTISNESVRRTSGSGNYPSTGYNGTYDSLQSLVGSYGEELQLLAGNYVYPSTNYTAFGGPNYSGASGLRWATFNLGSITGRAAFTLTINGLSGISSKTGNANFFLEVKVDGSVPSKWVDGDAANPGSGNPGGGLSDGDPAALESYSGTSASVRRITFGSLPKTGNVVVRIGWNNTLGTSVQFTSITISDLA
jgi:hypothetical protein